MIIGLACEFSTKGLFTICLTIGHMPDYRVGELSTKGLIHHMPDNRAYA